VIDVLPRWEYAVLSLIRASTVQSRLDEVGQNGWELVSVIPLDPMSTNVTLYLKREL
jgi:hypothetical protein